MNSSSAEDLFEILKIPKTKQQSFKTAVINQIEQSHGQARKLEQMSEKDMEVFATHFFLAEENTKCWWPDMKDRLRWVSGDEIDRSLVVLLKIWSKNKSRALQSHLSRQSNADVVKTKISKKSLLKAVGGKVVLERGESSRRPRGVRNSNERLIDIEDGDGEHENSAFQQSIQIDPFDVNFESQNDPLPDIPHRLDSVGDEPTETSLTTSLTENAMTSAKLRTPDRRQATKPQRSNVELKGKAPVRDRDPSYQPSQCGILEMPYMSPPPTTRTAEKRKMTPTIVGDGESVGESRNIQSWAKRVRPMQLEHDSNDDADIVMDTTSPVTKENGFADEVAIQEQQAEYAILSRLRDVPAQNQATVTPPSPARQADDAVLSELHGITEETAANVTQPNNRDSIPVTTQVDAFEELSGSLKNYLLESKRSALRQANNTALTESERARHQLRAGILEHAYCDILSRIYAVRARRNNPEASFDVSSFLQYY